MLEEDAVNTIPQAGPGQARAFSDPAFSLMEFRKGMDDAYESFHEQDWLTIQEVMQVARDFCLQPNESLSESYRAGFLTTWLNCYAETVGHPFD